MLNDTQERQLRSLPNVIGWSGQLHNRVRKGEILDQLCVRVYLRKKVSISELNVEELVPQALDIDGTLCTTDCVVLGDLQALTSSPDPWRAGHGTVPAGISCGHEDVTVGTIGGFVTGKVDYQDYMLSNAHVLSPTGAQVGDMIYQPGVSDQPDGWKYHEEYKLGRLISSIYPALDQKNLVDCAICTIDFKSFWYYAYYGLGSFYIPDIIEPVLDMRVKKSGRTTHVTEGRIIDPDATVFVRYPEGDMEFVHQILIQGSTGPFLEGGDSGSMLFQYTGRLGEPEHPMLPVGLCFAGSPEVGIANPISTVLDQLGLYFRNSSTDYPEQPPINEEKYGPSSIIESILIKHYKESVLDINVDPPVAIPGGTIVVSGRLDGKENGDPLVGRIVSVSITDHGMVNLMTDSNGMYNVETVLSNLSPSGTRLEITAEFLGDD